MGNYDLKKERKMKKTDGKQSFDTKSMSFPEIILRVRDRQTEGTFSGIKKKSYLLETDIQLDRRTK